MQGGGGVNKFSSARPNNEEGTSQGAQSCMAYISSCFLFRITASWGAQSQNADVSSRFHYTMALCDCVSRRGEPFCVQSANKNMRMDVLIRSSKIRTRSRPHSRGVPISTHAGPRWHTRNISLLDLGAPQVLG